MCLGFYVHIAEFSAKILCYSRVWTWKKMTLTYLSLIFQNFDWGTNYEISSRVIDNAVRYMANPEYYVLF